MATAPLCKICSTRHWSRERHLFAVERREGTKFVSELEDGDEHTFLPNGTIAIANPNKAPRIIKPGRPLEKDKAETLSATKPWIALGMSRRTWYRRQKEKREDK